MPGTMRLTLFQLLTADLSVQVWECSGSGLLEVEKYLGTEIEGTLSWTLHPGVNLDFIGSVVLAGDGLTDLLELKALRTAEDTIWAYQTRLMVYIDQFMK